MALASSPVERWYLRDVYGAELPLYIADHTSYPQVVLARGATGLGMPTFTSQRDRRPGQTGSILRDIRVDERSFGLPVFVIHRDRAGLWSSLRDLRRRVNPLRGEVALICVGPDGGRRELVAYYEGGLEDDSGGEDDQPEWQRHVVSFVAQDPWYRDADELTQNWTATASHRRPFFPLLPLRLSSVEFLVAPQIVVGGDLVAWPRWLVTGPTDSILLRNDTTGDRLTLTLVLAAGETLTIDTNPRQPRIERSNGERWFPQQGSSLWGLVPGLNPEDTNSLHLAIGGATTNTSLQLFYRRLFLGP